MRFMKGICSNNRMSCIGVYRRNVLSFNQTFYFMLFWVCSAIIDLILQTGLTYSEKYYSRNKLFWIWNTKGFALNELLLLVIPFALNIPLQQKTNVNKSGFFVTYPTPKCMFAECCLSIT